MSSKIISLKKQALLIAAAIGLAACGDQQPANPAASTPAACKAERAAKVVPPLLVTRSRSTAGGSPDWAASALAPLNVAMARRSASAAGSPICPPACCMASRK